MTKCFANVSELLYKSENLLFDTIFSGMYFNLYNFLFLFASTVRRAFQISKRHFAAFSYLADPPQRIADKQFLVLHFVAAYVGIFKIFNITLQVFLTHFFRIKAMNDSLY